MMYTMDVEQWFEKYQYKCTSFSNIKKLVEIKKRDKTKISLCIPTLNEEDNIGRTLDIIKEKLYDENQLIDEIVVVDSGSTDKTKKEVEKRGVKFYSADDILKKHGKVKGKGENLWKSLYICTGDIIVWIDADIKNMHPRFVYGLIGPLLTNKKLGLVKGFYQRPLRVGKETMPLGGGRVTELTIRPLFNMYFPRLSGFIQPLSGEYAGRRWYLERIPFFTGYGVETGMLIDFAKKFGLRRIAQVDLIRRVHRNSPLSSLSNMSFGILQVFAKRANSLGKLILVKKLRKKMRIIEHSSEARYVIKPKTIQETERPPIITLPEYRRKFKKDPKWVYY